MEDSLIVPMGKAPTNGNQIEDFDVIAAAKGHQKKRMQVIFHFLFARLHIAHELGDGKSLAFF